MSARVIRLAVAFVLASGVLLGVAVAWTLHAGRADAPGVQAAEHTPGHWPQWRGPDRSAVSAETGLLSHWPEQGPPLAWKAVGLGDGVASVAVAGGRVFTLGEQGLEEHLIALDEASGRKLWSVPVDSVPGKTGLNRLMRWLSQRTPTVDGDRVYAVSARGQLLCCKTADGTELWRRSYPEDFKGKTGAWGWSDRPLVDGDRLICTPGGPEATVVALEKKMGKVVWQCTAPSGYYADYSATVVAEVGGVRQFVVFLGRGLVGIAAETGKCLWTYEGVTGRFGNNYTPLVRGDSIFCASGYGRAMALLKLIPEQGGIRVQEVWKKTQALPPWHDGAIHVGDHVYLGTGNPGVLCIERATGQVAWQDRGAIGGSVAMAAADGHLYLFSQKGEAALVEATPERYQLNGKLQLPDVAAKSGVTAPVIAGGRLYLRDDDRLFCFEIKEGATVKPVPEPSPAKSQPKPAAAGPALVPLPPRSPDEPDVVFVPTPQDVVERMVALARLKQEEVVYDLGCGDGRIVVTAARVHGCRAVGYDIDPDCVRMAQENVRLHGVDRLVTIERKDIFTVDLHEADAVMLYLSPELNERLLPQLAQLKPGSRIVSHAFTIPGVPPDQVVAVPSEEDELDHQIYVWTTPLKKTR
jgi:outer membrane protein assembly factor BamB